MEQLNGVSTLGQNLARSKNKEPYTECPSFWWFWHHFVFNRALNQLKMAAKDASLLYKEKMGEMSYDPKSTVDSLRRKPRVNDQVYFSSVLTLLLFSWFSFHTFTYFSGRVIQKINIKDFSGGPAVKTPCLQCCGHGFSPWSGKFHTPCGAAKHNNNLFFKIFFLICFLKKKVNLKTSKGIKSGSLTASLMPYL